MIKQWYRWCSQIARPSWGWDRVGHWRYGHQAMKRAHIHGISIDVLMYRAGLIIHATTATSRVVVDGGTLQARKEQLGPVSSMRYRTSTSGLSTRSEEHTSELQSLMRISYAVFCLKKKKTI